MPHSTIHKSINGFLPIFNNINPLKSIPHKYRIIVLRSLNDFNLKNANINKFFRAEGCMFARLHARCRFRFSNFRTYTINIRVHSAADSFAWFRSICSALLIWMRVCMRMAAWLPIWNAGITALCSAW